MHCCRVAWRDNFYFGAGTVLGPFEEDQYLSFIERRRAYRFELRSPILIKWKDDDENREAQAVSEDISSNGIYFVLQTGIKKDTPVILEMTLPNEITLAGPVRVHCFGHIQRCDVKEGSTSGMAVAIEKYKFLREGKQPASTLPQNRSTEE